MSTAHSTTFTKVLSSSCDVYAQDLACQKAEILTILRRVHNRFNVKVSVQNLARTCIF